MFFTTLDIDSLLLLRGENCKLSVWDLKALKVIDIFMNL